MNKLLKPILDESSTQELELEQEDLCEKQLGIDSVINSEFQQGLDLKDKA